MLVDGRRPRYELTGEMEEHFYPRRYDLSSTERTDELVIEELRMIRNRVLIADDLPPVLSTVFSLLEEAFDVVAMEADGRAALSAAINLKPDIVVLDISMPILSGIEVAHELTRLGNKAKIVFLTVHEDTDILRACHAAGGLGYVVKVRMDSDLIPAMEEALAGREFTSSFSNDQETP
jgi:DNA-binding NarL/FixJ family response regulator